MKALVEFIENYQKGFSDSVEPASDIEIEDLEAVAGYLPEVYKRFLRTMGKSTGKFDILDMSFNISNIIMAYELQSQPFNDQFLLIASDNGPSGSRCFLDRGTTYLNHDCMVVNTLYYPTNPIAVNDQLYYGLEELLYFEAYRTIRLRLFPNRIELIPNIIDQQIPCTAEQIITMAMSLGFKRIGASQYSIALERVDAGIALYRRPNSNAFSMQLGCTEANELKSLVAIFRKELKMEI